ncbi:unnamed protein product [Adineta steineri]|uniref:Condensation domain-containing protein n=1 Tax=Adineta steineri TaxID=433720 RepID=A0A819WS16_9BILA|nr:unnamed protein product [Adineta steineri]CAF1125265.1 unnamed protein product [Adineta steineri]CAF1195440.1 unnamed protein product [Adineta steineri]CAF3953199.1 unnamed protein product [Adineta steineri]CAF4093464.1 unnamed protein product [Adineta steineri]
MSIERIRSAITATLEEHTVLRTAIYFDEEQDQLKQEVQPVAENNGYSSQLTKKSVPSIDEIRDLLKNEFINHFAKLNYGLVVRCHLVKVGIYNNMENLFANDLIIFILHRIAFDYNSAGPLIIAFIQADDQIKSDVPCVQYIDYSLYEHLQWTNPNQDAKIRQAQQFWSRMMDGYRLSEKHSLPITSTRPTQKRSGRSNSISFTIDSTLVKSQIEFALS